MNNISEFDPAVEIDGRVISEDIDNAEYNSFNSDYQDDSDIESAIKYNY